MKKLWLYLSNVGIAIWNLVRAVFGLYQYHPGDSWLYNLWVVFDCLVNTLALGDPHETVSSRSAKAQAYEQSKDPPSYGWGCRFCSFLATFQQDHCAKALERNVGSRAVVPDDNP
jgi:hypothetical protein